MLNYLVDVAGRLGDWAYLIVFLGATLESAAMLGLVVPGEALVLACAFMASRGALDLDALFWAVAAGAIIGDSIGYALGRKLGRPAALRFGPQFGVSAQRLERVEQFFNLHGPASVFLGRFVGFARAMVPFLAGASRMRYRTFLAFNVAGAALWAGALVLLGYFVGGSLQRLEGWIGHAALLLVGASALVWVLRGRVKTTNRLWLELGLMGLALFLFAAVAEDVVTKDPLTRVDQQITMWWAAHREPWLTQALRTVSFVHGTAPVTVAVMGIASWFVRCGERRWLASLIGTVPLGMLLNVGLKHLFHRGRPVLDEPLVHLTTYSFPSGHVAGATLLYGFLCTYIIAHTRSRRLHVLVIVIAICLVSLVAFSRIYLGAHFLSDVLGAAAMSVAWLTLVLSCAHGSLNRAVVERVYLNVIAKEKKNGA